MRLWRDVVSCCRASRARRRAGHAPEIIVVPHRHEHLCIIVLLARAPRTLVPPRVGRREPLEPAIEDEAEAVVGPPAVGTGLELDRAQQVEGRRVHDDARDHLEAVGEAQEARSAREREGGQAGSRDESGGAQRRPGAVGLG